MRGFYYKRQKFPEACGVPGLTTLVRVIVFAISVSECDATSLGNVLCILF